MPTHMLVNWVLRACAKLRIEAEALVIQAEHPRGGGLAERGGRRILGRHHRSDALRQGEAEFRVQGVDGVLAFRVVGRGAEIHHGGVAGNQRRGLPFTYSSPICTPERH
jgi:hypothetical protein